MVAVSLTNIRKTYDAKEVLHGIDLELKGGEFVVIVGPSGCGKSTLLRMIAGLEEITSGRIAIAGEVVNDRDPADRGCAMVFQNYALYPHMTVAENIGYPLKIAGVSRGERLRRVQETAAILGLQDYLDRRPGQLSGGQRQRVAMGRAIMRQPRLFLFDEPLSNLDAKMRVQMRIEIRRLHRKLGATSIFVTHDQIEAMTLADRLVVMNGGRIEQVGRPEDIYASPATTFVAAFLGTPPMNLINAVVTGAGMAALENATDFLQQTAPFDLPVDARMILGIRPEDICLSAGGGRGLPATIDLIEELGGSRVAYCLAGDREIAAIVPRDMPLRESARVTLGFDPKWLHAFDATTGLRLGNTHNSRPPSGAPTAEIPGRSGAMKPSAVDTLAE